MPAEPKPAPPEAKQVEEDKKGEAGSSDDLLVVHLKNGATVSLQVGCLGRAGVVEHGEDEDQAQSEDLSWFAQDIRDRG